MNLLTAILFVFAIFSCGQEEAKKDYVLQINSQDTVIIDETKRLISEFNRQAGAEILKQSDDSNKANSVIAFDPDLEKNEGKIGYGQWIYTEDDSAGLDFGGNSGAYSMSLLFDEEFIHSRAGLPKTDPKWQELFLLFCHEVGHGMGFDHNDERSDVMFPYIGVKAADYSQYFGNVLSWVAE